MIKYIGKRLLALIPVLLVVSVVIFLLIHLVLGMAGLGIYAAVCWLLGEREALLLITKKFRKQDA